MGKEAKASAVKSAMGVANDIAAGKVSADDLDREAHDAVLELAGQVVGPDDPIWPVHVSIGRQLLAVGGWVTADELAEWTAVYRAAEADAAPESLPSVDSIPTSVAELDEFERELLAKVADARARLLKTLDADE